MIMIRRRLLQLLEHGTVPTMALAIAIAAPDSMSRQTHDLTKPAKLRTDVLFSAIQDRYDDFGTERL